MPNLRDILSPIISDATEVKHELFTHEDEKFVGKLLYRNYDLTNLDAELKEIHAQLQGHDYDYTVKVETIIKITAENLNL